MSLLTIDTGSAINAGDGEAIRNAFVKINDMMAEIYGWLTTNGFDPAFLPANSVLNGKLGQMPGNTIKANLTGLAASPSDVSYSMLASAIGVAPAVSTISSAYSVIATDIGRALVASGSFTISLLAASTAGNGFSFSLVNAGVGVITLDPNASETINGAATLAVYPGETALVVCDGSGWRTLFSAAEPVIAKGVLGAPGAALTLDLPAEFQSFQIKLENLVAVSGTPEVYCRLRVGGSFLTTGYVWSQWYASGSSAAYTSASGPVQGAGLVLSSGATSQASTDPEAHVIDIFPGSPSKVAGLVHRSLFTTYNNSGGGRTGTVGRADQIEFRMSGPTNLAAGAIYSVKGIRS